MAVGPGCGDPSFRGKAVLLRTHPRSGANLFAARLLDAFRDGVEDEHDYIVDLDYLVEQGQLTAYLDRMRELTPVIVVKTHLSRCAFVERHPSLCEAVMLELNLFRTPLDVAVSTHRYLRQWPRAMRPGQVQDFAPFFDEWVRRDGTCALFEQSGFSGWIAYAEEACAGNRATWPMLHHTYDDVRLRGATIAAGVRALVGGEQRPADQVADGGGSGGRALLDSLGTGFSYVQSTSYLAGGDFGSLYQGDGYAAALGRYIERFGPVVNRLITELHVPARLI